MTRAIAFSVCAFFALLVATPMCQAADPPQQTPAAAVKLTLSRLGVDADSFAAVGCSAEEVAAFVAYAKEKTQLEASEIESAETSVAEARHSLMALRARRARDHEAVQGSDIEAAVQTLKAASDARDTVYQSIYLYAREAVDTARRATLDVLRLNSARSVPIRYRVKERTVADWDRLTKALGELKQRRTMTANANTEATSIVDSFDAEPETYQASENLQSLSATLRLAWESALNG